MVGGFSANPQLLGFVRGEEKQKTATNVPGNWPELLVADVGCDCGWCWSVDPLCRLRKATDLEMFVAESFIQPFLGKVPSSRLVATHHLHFL